MKKIIVITSFLFFALTAAAQQTIKSENVNSFNSISITGRITAELITSDVNKIDITLNDVDINKFKWNVRNGVLNIELNSGQKGKGNADIKIYYADTLRNISVSGSDLISAEPVRGGIAKLSVSSGAKVTLEYEVLDLDVSVTGNAAAHLTGTTKYLSMHATEKSKVDARQLECVSAEADTATGAEVYINASERLVANAKTTSTIFYRGHPEILKDRTSKMNSGMMGSSVLNIGE